MIDIVDQEIIKNQNKEIDIKFRKLSQSDIEYFFDNMENYHHQVISLIDLNNIRIDLLNWIIKTSKTCNNLYSKTYEPNLK